MAYLGFSELGGPAMARAAVTRPVKASAPAPRAASLSALEWQVVALAQKDRIATLRSPGRLAMAMGALFGERHNPRLADPQLEALRRMAVLSWHHGYTVAPHEVRRFLAAGYSADQYELMVDSINAGRTARGANTGLVIAEVPAAA